MVVVVMSERRGAAKVSSGAVLAQPPRLSNQVPRAEPLPAQQHPSILPAPQTTTPPAVNPPPARTHTQQSSLTPPAPLRHCLVTAAPATPAVPAHYRQSQHPPLAIRMSMITEGSTKAPKPRSPLASAITRSTSAATIRICRGAGCEIEMPLGVESALPRVLGPQPNYELQG